MDSPQYIPYTLTLYKSGAPWIPLIHTIYINFKQIWSSMDSPLYIPYTLTLYKSGAPWIPPYTYNIH